MNYKLERIALEDIVTDNYTFCHRFKVELLEREDPLAVPIVLIKRKKYIILSGFRRMLTIISQGKEKSIVALIPSDSVSDKALFSLSLEYNRNAVLSDIDRACIVHKALDNFSFTKEQAVKSLSDICSVDRSWKMIERYAYAATLEDDIKEYCIRMRLGIKFCCALLDLSIDERQFFLKEIFSHVFFTESEMQQCADMINELKVIEQCDLQSLFSQEWCTTVLDNQDLTDKGRARLLLRGLWSMRNPYVAGLNEKVASVKKALAFNNKLSFSAPDSFERNYYSLEMRFSTQDEIKKSLNDLLSHIDVFNDVEQIMKVTK
ncbi:hypothetical protein ACFL3D_00155 [Candidatus Omnitrophota bacterium]